MRQTRVPAQITTVEDRIAGNLNFTQILLLLGALFFSTFVYLVFPSPIKLTVYKIPIMIVSTLLFLLLALRIKGKVILNWIVIITTYSFRPQYYVFNKNDMTEREIIAEDVIKKTKVYTKQKAKGIEKRQNASLSDVMAVERVLLNPNQNVRFAFKKGGINVHVSENK